VFNNLISNSVKELQYKFFIDNFSGVSGVENTLPIEHYNGFYNVIPEPQSTITIKPKSLTEIIHSTSINHIDFMSLDVEGHEYEVLLSWDFSVPIDVILIEKLGGSESETDEVCRNFLINNG
jgi:hypothetical protein